MMADDATMARYSLRKSLQGKRVFGVPKGGLRGHFRENIVRNVSENFT
jgi:hypothetical protein